MMKYYYLPICLLLFISYFGSAQNIDLNLQPYFYNVPTIVKLSPNNDIIIGGYGRENIFASWFHYLAFINEENERVWEFTDFSPVGWINDIIVTDHEIIVIGSGNYSCDAVGGNFIYKFDYDGNVLYADNFDDGLGTQLRPISKACLDSNENLLAIGNFGFEVWSPTNELLFFNRSFHFDWLREITDVECIGEDFLIAGYGKGFLANEDDERCSLSKAQFYDFDNHITVFYHCLIEQDTLYSIDVVKKDSVFLISGKDYLYKYCVSTDGFFSPILKYELTENQYIVDVQHYHQNTYLFLGEQDHYKMFILDNELNYQSEIVLDLPELLIVDHFKIRNDKILLVGRDKSAHTQYYSQHYDEHSSSSIFLKEYDLDTILIENSNLDIEITNIWSDHPYVIDQHCPQFDFSCGIPVTMFYENISVEITNNSDIPIHSFNLNARYDRCEECQGICHVTHAFSQKYSGLNIASEASQTLGFAPFLQK